MYASFSQYFIDIFQSILFRLCEQNVIKSCGEDPILRPMPLDYCQCFVHPSFTIHFFDGYTTGNIGQTVTIETNNTMIAL